MKPNNLSAHIAAVGSWLQANQIPMDLDMQAVQIISPDRSLFKLSIKHKSLPSESFILEVIEWHNFDDADDNHCPIPAASAVGIYETLDLDDLIVVYHGDQDLKTIAVTRKGVVMPFTDNTKQHEE